MAVIVSLTENGIKVHKAKHECSIRVVCCKLQVTVLLGYYPHSITSYNYMHKLNG